MTAQAANRLNDGLVPIFSKVEGQRRPVVFGDQLVYEQSDGMTEFSRQEFEKGVRVGILMVVDFPRAQEEFLDEEVKRLREMLSNEEDEDGGS